MLVRIPKSDFLHFDLVSRGWVLSYEVEDSTLKLF